MLPTGRIFMEMTRYEHLSPSDQSLQLPAPPLEKNVPSSETLIQLPDPSGISIPPLDLRSAIEGRRSIRHYTKDPIGFEELAYLLWCTQGTVKVQDPYFSLRNVPSAGGRHALESYLVANRVNDTEPGLYRYLPFSHQLAVIERSKDIADRAMAACLGQGFIRTSAVTFIWTAVIYRMAWRYSERAYRLVHLDAGHVAQNLYLAAGQIGCGVCSVGAFDDQQIAGLLHIDGTEEFALYAAAVGKTR